MASKQTEGAAESRRELYGDGIINRDKMVNAADCSSLMSTKVPRSHSPWL